MPRKGIARPQAASAAGAQATGVRTRASVTAASNSVLERSRIPEPSLESRGAASPPFTGHSDHSSPLPPTPVHPPPLGYPLRFRTPSPPPASSPLSSPLPDLPFVCDCGRSFRTQAGLTIHSRCAHAEAFHALLAARASQRGSSHAHWSDDELILLARLAAAGAGLQGTPYSSPTPTDVTVNDAIAAGIAKRPRRAAVPERRTRPVAIDPPAPLDSPAPLAAAPEVAGDDRSEVEPAAGEDRPAEEGHDPEGTVHWFDELWGKIRDGDLKLPRPQATPGALTDEIRLWVDQEYALWAPATIRVQPLPPPLAAPTKAQTISSSAASVR